MEPRALILACAAVAGALMAGSPSAHAADAQDAEECTPRSPVSPIADRAGAIEAFRQLPDSCLKHIVLECNRATTERVLDLGTAAMCSIGYEALLSKSFGGNFPAMLAWWQEERRPAE